MQSSPFRSHEYLRTRSATVVLWLFVHDQMQPDGHAAEARVPESISNVVLRAAFCRAVSPCFSFFVCIAIQTECCVYIRTRIVYS